MSGRGFRVGSWPAHIFGHETQPREGELPEESEAPALGTLQALLEDLHGSLEAVLAQDRQGFLQSQLPGRQGVGCFNLARRTGGLQMRHDIGTDPGAGGGIGERCTVVETQFDDAGQTPNQKREVHFHLAHGQFSVQSLQAFPDHSLAIEPEGRVCQACLQVNQQVCVFALIIAILIVLELVHQQPAHHGNLLGVALGNRVDGQPRQRAIEAQGAHISGFLLKPPGTQRTGAFQLSPQGL